MNYFKLDKFDSADGIGIRVGLYISGCTHKCKGCHSSEFWDFSVGQSFTKYTIEEIKSALSEYYISGLSILGGDPLEPKNIHDVSNAIKELSTWYYTMYEKPLNIWMWTGDTYENLMKILNESDNPIYNLDYKQSLKTIMDHLSVLVDGPFIESKKDFNIAFRGSNNQRIINMIETNKTHKLTLLNIKENIH